MKNIISLLAVLVIMICIVSGCSKDNTTNNSGTGGGRTFSCTGINPTFSADVQPILTSLCSINSNCHASGSTNSGGVLTNYTQVNAKKSNIRAAIINGTMPQSGTITQAQINAFICWIDSGAPNN